MLFGLFFFSNLVHTCFCLTRTICRRTATSWCYHSASENRQLQRLKQKKISKKEPNTNRAVWSGLDGTVCDYFYYLFIYCDSSSRDSVARQPLLDRCCLLPFVGVRERIPELLEPEFPLRKEPSLQRSREAAQVKLVFLIGFLRPRVDVRFGGRFQTLIVGVPSEAAVDTLQRGLTGVTTTHRAQHPRSSWPSC